MSILPNIFKQESEIPPEYRLERPISVTHYLCDGKLVEFHGETTKVTSPICEQVDGKWVPTFIGTTPNMTDEQVVSCLDAAVRAYSNGAGAWPTMPIEGRIRHVEAFVEELIKRRSLLINLLMWEICKNVTDATKEFDRTIDYIRDTINALKDLDRGSSRFEIKDDIVAQIRRAPLGVVLCMGPFNYPFNETMTTLLPAIIMGNTCVFKPPKHGTIMFKPIIECFAKAFPAGVVNSIFGPGGAVITPIITTGKIDVLAFIGSSGVADKIRVQHPHPHRLRCVLGLDAKNPAIICKDADLDLAARECVLGALSFNGERCTAIKIIFVHEAVANEFVEKVCKEVAKLKVGLPWDKKEDGTYCNITPLPERGKVGWMQQMTEDAVSKGAKVVNEHGGDYNETCYSPAVVFPVTKEMKLFHEEQFGPIVPISVFNDLDVPIEFIRESKFGQQVAIFGRDADEIAHLVDPLVNQVCRVNINCQCQRGPDTFPFTGRKDSAEGTLSVSDALRCFSIRTLVAAKKTPMNTAILQEIVHDRKSAFLSTDFIF
ncbi:glyceraldehyde-3-phosphate dehydrogenase (NADP(+)) (GAPN) [Monocercomonoides exilis]|uniref:glyceraldehyde-3-phosphate dehydrogenase (NADP(+)) (GAPN) n=1 Tax=Monocercomonoides exilis TaxID=2049356 RepID=UPI003559AC93|nr:glyceraldehyde-3-phosphate dehydrogenase (NADP(+)) (GAPN) [Monocercomonoides exilis]|eukprot:MONOS_3653.1-p1 / transcript=MONOS_3653.1 / gene=MONOS_3653 / organism=Monocercomonoides_exilis_PA203 / gene_product=glyceraldehyde-3-phosphate dehydrogenase (NADP(+)) (GAPN) / transcript_product=glyceraldehyde-3-phosphate dehydrogenase (NADP(+)) (GAPN) / location=Mono_scaffold00088:28856-30556(-) / protein_length=544 / sequence_SO=supercontig / SO=protein_coding / is_pseudo=false